MQLHELQSKSKKNKKRVGRGGSRGKTSGRGHKGQKARAGGTPRPQIRDIIKKIPKLRGHGKNRARTVHDSRKRPAIVNLEKLEAYYIDGEHISPETLVEKGIVELRGGRIPQIKILGGGEVSKKFIIEGCLLSASARQKIEGAGGKIT